jgi:hypothetical protein
MPIKSPAINKILGQVHIQQGIFAPIAGHQKLSHPGAMKKVADES